MIERMAGASPRLKARVAGVFYLLTLLTAGFAVLVRGKIVVFGDLASTAANILAHETFFQLGFAADLIAGACYIAVTALSFALLRPVNRSLAWVATIFSLMGCAVGAQADQFQGLARFYNDTHGTGFNTGLMFFGLGSTVFSYLWFKSSYIPRTLAALGVFSSLLVATGSFAYIIFPNLSEIFVPGYLAPIVIFEVTMGSWLLLKGLRPSGIAEPDNVSG